MYEGKFRKYINQDLKNTLEAIEKSKDRYQDILFQYEISMGKVLNTIQNTKEIMKWTTEPIENALIELMDGFIQEVKVRKKVFDDALKEENVATEKSFIEQINEEIHYINWYKETRKEYIKG